MKLKFTFYIFIIFTPFLSLSTPSNRRTISPEVEQLRNNFIENKLWCLPSNFLMILEQSNKNGDFFKQLNSEEKLSLIKPFTTEIERQSESVCFIPTNSLLAMGVSYLIGRHLLNIIIPKSLFSISIFGSLCIAKAPALYKLQMLNTNLKTLENLLDKD